MAVRCAQCDEELLGAVNRCWRCGAPVLSRPGETEVPPVRRAPLPVLTAELVGDSADHVLTADLVEDAGSAADAVAPPATRRVGSPFAPGPGDRRGVLTAVSVTTSPPPSPPHRVPTAHASLWPPYEPRRDTLDRAASNGAIAGLVLGLISVVVSAVSWSAAALALIGFALAIWGLRSPRRRTALAGVAMCCVTLAVVVLQAVVLWYELRYGFKPWMVPTGL